MATPLRPTDYAQLMGNASTAFTGSELPLATPRIACGFPSPAQDHSEDRLDLVRRLVEHPLATYFAIAHGNSMDRAGILDRGILVVDRALTPRHGSVVLAAVDGEFTCKRLCLSDHGKVRLLPDSSDDRFRPIEPTPEQDFHVWGVVRAVVNEFVRATRG